MGQKITGRNFDISLDDQRIHVMTASVEITDNTAADKTGGIPDGWTSGDVEASGEIVVDARNLALLTERARNAGSWRELPVFDMLFYAKTPDSEKKVKVHDCKLMVSSLLDIDTNGADKESTTLPFIVTGSDFVWIGGVPYLSQAETEGLA